MSGNGSSFRTEEFEDFRILIGKGAEENEELTFEVAAPDDFWLHVSGYSGSHVVILNPDRLTSLPRRVLERAAMLAAWHSKARGSKGKVEVHCCQVSDVSKPRGFRKGQVRLRDWKSIKVYARELTDGSG